MTKDDSTCEFCGKNDWKKDDKSKGFLFRGVFAVSEPLELTVWSHTCNGVKQLRYTPPSAHGASNDG